jgi:hypothetical protein
MWIGVIQLLVGSGGILLMWDRRVVKKIKECGRVYCCMLF